MRTIETNVYTFDELSEDMQEKAIENLYDINTSFDWWELTYDDAANIGLKITSFELDRHRHAEGELNFAANEVAANILKEHGEGCETHKTATNFLKDWAGLVEKYSDGEKLDQVTEDNEFLFDQEADELEEEFLKSILEDYSIMLQKEFEYLQSEEAIKEAIEANEYEFTVDGELI